MKDRTINAIKADSNSVGVCLRLGSDDLHQLGADPRAIRFYNREFGWNIIFDTRNGCYDSIGRFTFHADNAMKLTAKLFAIGELYGGDC